MLVVLKFGVISIIMVTSSDLWGEASSAAAAPVKSESVNSKNWSQDVSTWRAPKEMAAELPYYIAGHDYENRPVIIAELGKWDTRKYADAGGEMAKMFDIYMEQFWWRVSNTTSKIPDAEDGVTLVFDCDGFTNRQINSAAAIRSHLRAARFSAWAESNVANILAFNVNFAIRSWFNFMRPLNGPLFGRTELYGRRNETWIPELRKRIPKDQLPPWYGGSGNFKPIQVFG